MSLPQLKILSRPECEPRYSCSEFRLSANMKQGGFRRLMSAENAGRPYVNYSLIHIRNFPSKSSAGRMWWALVFDGVVTPQITSISHTAVCKKMNIKNPAGCIFPNER